MRVTIIIAALAALIVGPALAQEPVGCDKFKWPVDRETAALRSSDMKIIASGGDFSGLPFAAKIELKAPKDAALPTPPERAPKEGSFAGFTSFKTAPKAGLYTISLSAGGWVDVVQDGHFVKPKGFSGATDCDGIRKTMKYELSASPFVLQVSGTRENSISIAILPTE